MTIDRIRSIETKYEVESIRFSGMQVWPMIRFSLWAYYQSGVKPIEANALGAARIFELLGQFFYGFKYFFRKYKYVALSDSSERKLIHGKWVDKSVDYILENLPRAFLIELPLPRHFKKSEIPSRFISSKLPLYALEKFYSFLFLRTLEIENEDIVKKILGELNCDFDYRSVLKRNIAQYRVGELLQWFYGPEAVIVQCSYTNIGLIKAFKDKGVKVIEVQHGLITSSHEAYNVFKRFDTSYYPDFFLAYGSTEKEIFRRSHFLVSEDRVIPVGHFYLDMLNASKGTKAEIIPEVVDYSFGVSITGQMLSVEEKLVEFIKEVAIRMPSICFFYLPRNSNSYIFKVANLPKNLVNASGRDTYEVIRLTSYHTTLFSTCAIEALALGTPNILVNIDNLAKVHFFELLGNSETTVFVETVDDYVATLNTFVPIRREKVIELNASLILSGYRKNIKKFLKEAGLV